MPTYGSPDELMQHYVAALKAGNADAVSEMYEEESVYYRPTMSVLARGRAAVTEFYRNFLESHEVIAVNQRRSRGTQRLQRIIRTDS